MNMSSIYQGYTHIVDVEKWVSGLFFLLIVCFKLLYGDKSLKFKNKNTCINN